jgi:predicted type IV restriction endonuclease
MGHSFSLAIKSLKKEFCKRTSLVMQSRKSKTEETTSLTAVALHEDEEDPEFVTAPFL